MSKNDAPCWCQPKELLIGGNPMWHTELANSHFSLQKRQNTGLAGKLVGTLDSVLDSSTRVFPYRIVYHPHESDVSYQIASGRNHNQTLQAWLWIEENVLETMVKFDTSSEQIEYVLGKITALLAQTDDNNKKGRDKTENEKDFKEAVLKFRQTFSLPADDNLVNWYPCALVSKMIPWQGWLYLSKNHCCFYSFLVGKEKKMIIRWTDVKDLSKQESLFLPEGIQILTTKNEKIYFSNFIFDFNNVFNDMKKLTNLGLRQLIDHEHTANENGPRSQTNFKSQLDTETKSLRYVRIFALPRNEILDGFIYD